MSKDRIVVLKTIGGEELIGTLHNDGRYSKVMVFQITQQGATLFPWNLMVADGKIIIKENAMAIEPFDAPMDMQEQYLKATSSIQLLS